MPQATDAVWVSVLPDMSGFGSGIASGASSAATTEGTNAGKKFGKAMLAGAAAIAGGAALATKALYNVGATFDDVADTIRVGTGATGDALDGLIASAKNVGKNVPAEFEAIGTVIADINTRLGLSGKTLETVASQYLEAGRILGEDVDIQKTSAAFSAFKIEGDAVVGAMDTLFQVSQATGVGMNELAASVQASGPAVQALGFSFEETAALVGSLDKAGINSNQTMAAMSKGLVTLAKDGEEPQAAFRRVTGEIDALVASGDTAGAIDLASGIFGTRAAVSFVGAVESGTLALDDLVAGTGATSDTILGVADDTADMAEQWRLFKNNALLAIEPIATRVFNALGDGMAWVTEIGVPALKAFAGEVKSGFTGSLEGALTPMQRVGDVSRKTFDYVKNTAIPALRDFGGWVQKNRAWIVPLAAGIGAIATAMLIARGAMAAWRVVTSVFIGVQAAFNAVLAANPIGLIVLAIVGLVAAFVVAYKQSETFRDIVNGVWASVQSAVSTVVAWFQGTVVPALSSAWAAISSGATALYENVIKPVWSGISGAIKLAWSIMKPIFDAYVAVWTFVGQVFWNVFTLVIQATWIAMQTVATAVWSWLSTRVFEPMRLIMGIIGQAFTDAYNNHIKPAWDLIKSAANGAWTWLRDNVFSKMGDATSKMGDAFNSAKDVIKTAWDAIKDAATGPVNFIIETVYTNGIKNLFDTVAEKLGLSQRLPSINKIGAAPASGRPVNRGAFAEGGVLPGWSPGRDIHEFYSPTGGRLSLSGGEAIMRPEFTRAVGGAAGVARLNAMFTGKGSSKDGQRFFLGGVWDKVSGALGAGWDFTKDAASAVSNFMKDPIKGALNVFSGPIEDFLKQIGGGDVGQIMAGAPRALVKGIIDGATRIFGPARDDGAEKPGVTIGQGMGITAMAAALKAAHPGARITSGYRPGAVTAVGTPSYHGQGRALDIAPNQAVFDWIAANFPNSRELIHTPMGNRQILNGRNFSAFAPITKSMHYDHIHWAMKNGGVWPGAGVFDNGGMLQPGQMAINLSNRPEPVFSGSQWDSINKGGLGGPPTEIKVYGDADPEATARAVMRRMQDDVYIQGLESISRGA